MAVITMFDWFNDVTKSLNAQGQKLQSFLKVKVTLT